MSMTLVSSNSDMKMMNYLMDEVFNIAYDSDNGISDYAMIIGTYESMLKSYLDPSVMSKAIQDLKKLKNLLEAESS